MASQVSSWSQLEAMLKAKIIVAMNTTVAPEIKELESQKADEVVYSYNATPYFMEGRRRNEGGLSDVRNMPHSTNISGNSIELTVDNITPSNEEFLPYWIRPHEIAYDVETGENYNYKDVGARPFISETREVLRQGKARELLVKGLKAQGLNAK